jgi:hypothetical protein
VLNFGMMKVTFSISNISMKKEDILRILNICLGVVLFVVFVVIIMMILGASSASSDYQKALDSSIVSSNSTSKLGEKVNLNSKTVSNEKEMIENEKNVTSTVDIPKQ